VITSALSPSHPLPLSRLNLGSPRMCSAATWRESRSFLLRFRQAVPSLYRGSRFLSATGDTVRDLSGGLSSPNPPATAWRESRSCLLLSLVLFYCLAPLPFESGWPFASPLVLWVSRRFPVPSTALLFFGVALPFLVGLLGLLAFLSCSSGVLSGLLGGYFLAASPCSLSSL